MTELHLGINVGHDRAAAVVADGAVLVAIEEERLDRVKHSPGIRRVGSGYQLALPQRAIEYCMEALDVDASAWATITANSPGVDHGPELARDMFGSERVLELPSHHLAHAYSAWGPSGFDEALVLVIDATGSTDSSGRTESYSLYAADSSGLTPLHAEMVDAGLTDLGTLGMLYEEITRRIGFITPVAGGLSHAEAGKTMGLAPYGNGGHMFGEWLRCQQGRLSVDIAAYDVLLELEALDATHVQGSGPRWRQPHLIELASKVQRELERAMLHIVGVAMQQTGLKKLCLAGGVALNSVANHRLVRELKLDDFFAFPAAGDSGIAAGAAMWACDTQSEAGAPRAPLRNAGLGRRYAEHEIEAALAAHEGDLEITRLSPDATTQQAAEALAAGRIVARFEGGSEYGPRALGHRSILADPTFARMRDVLNLRVKHRESYRPFAPVVPESRAEEVFSLSVKSPFMLLVAPIRAQLHERIPAVTHCDGTGRVQTVTAADNPFFHDVIEALVARRGGEPVLLNTSFNVAGEPIVETPADALRTFLACDIDHLAMEGYWISKAAANERTYEDHVAGLPDAELPRGSDDDGGELKAAVDELHAALEGAPSGRFRGAALDEIRRRAAPLRASSFRFPLNESQPPRRAAAPAPRRPQSAEGDPVLAVFADEDAERPALATIRAFFESASYDAAGVRARLGKHPQELEPTDLHYLDHFKLGGDPLDQLIRLFLLRGRLGEDRCRSLFGSERFAQMLELGLVQSRDGDCSATIDVYPVGALLIATDHRYHVRSDDQLDEEPVMYLGRDSIGLAMAAPRAATRHHLDLCTGSGVQALVAASYAEQVIGVDINPRALRFARFNAAWNDVRNATFLPGDLYEPVRGRRFGSVTANPPFVPSPSSNLAFRDGGADGEAVLRRIIEGAPAHLEPEGRLSIVTDLAAVTQYAEKLSGWWGQTGYVAQILTTADRDELLFSVPHAHAPFGQRYEEYCQELEAWINSYRRAKLSAVNFGYLVVQDIAPQTNKLTYTKVVDSPLTPVWQRVQALLDFQRMQASSQLGKVSLRAADGLTVRTDRPLDERSEARHVVVAGDEDPWFTQYTVDAVTLSLLRRAAKADIAWHTLVEEDLDGYAVALVEKGLLVSSGTVQGGASALSPQGKVHIDEAASKTTPTCLSNYLR